MKRCKHCGDPEPKHWPFQCFQNPKYGKYKMPKAGKVNFASKMTRMVWFQKNPPNYQGGYICYLCKRFLFPHEVTLDHVIPKSRAPELRHDLTNLEPCCYKCNLQKGSRVLDGQNL